MPHLMEAQLDPGAADVLRRQFDQMGLRDSPRDSHDRRFSATAMSRVSNSRMARRSTAISW